MCCWGLEEGTKILWIHCDEKWFHGIVPRTNAKACPELGIQKSSHSAHHKKHIAKVMAHCCVGYMFQGDVEDGGDGFLISCDRVASYKMPLRNSYESSRDETGKLKYKGNAVIHTKGIPYLVDCNVTGVNPGTPTNPFYPLQKLWEYTLIPGIAQLIDTGGPCAGATVVVQQDNAGPHIEEAYSLWIHEQFESLGWKYEPQAPQGIENVVCSLEFICHRSTITIYCIVILSSKFTFPKQHVQVHTQMCWTCTCFPPCHIGIAPSFSGSQTQCFVRIVFGEKSLMSGMTPYRRRSQGIP